MLSDREWSHWKLLPYGFWWGGFTIVDMSMLSAINLILTPLLLMCRYSARSWYVYCIQTIIIGFLTCFFIKPSSKCLSVLGPVVNVVWRVQNTTYLINSQTLSPKPKVEYSLVFARAVCNKGPYDIYIIIH